MIRDVEQFNNGQIVGLKQLHRKYLRGLLLEHRLPNNREFFWHGMGDNVKKTVYIFAVRVFNLKKTQSGNLLCWLNVCKSW